MQPLRLILLIYIAGISLFGMIITIYDKIAAKKRPRQRIRERTLILSAIFGGAPVIFLTMQLIRHKTKHHKIIGVTFLAAVFWIAAILYIIFRFDMLWEIILKIKITK